MKLLTRLFGVFRRLPVAPEYRACAVTYEVVASLGSQLPRAPVAMRELAQGRELLTLTLTLQIRRVTDPMSPLPVAQRKWDQQLPALEANTKSRPRHPRSLEPSRDV
jgi:hypothetical protein